MKKVKKLKTERDVLDFVFTLTLDEARNILNALEGDAELMEGLKAQGLMVNFVRKRKERYQDPDAAHLAAKHRNGLDDRGMMKMI